MVIAAMVGTAVLSAGGTATAARLITSADIKNDTIRLADISDSAERQLRGRQGPRGPAGPAGSDAAGGESEETIELRLSYRSDGTTTGYNEEGSRQLPILVSQQTVAAGSWLRALSINATGPGAKAGCNYFVYPYRGGDYMPEALAASQTSDSGGRTQELYDPAVLPDEAQKFVLYGECTSREVNYEYQVIPDVDIRVVFERFDTDQRPTRSID